MSLTLVTALYDLSKRGVNQHRSVEWMIEHGDYVLGLPQHLVIFTEPELADVLLAARGNRPTTIATWPLEDLHELDSCMGAIQENATRTKVTPAYIHLMQAKYAMLDRVLQDTEATHIGWIDFGITHIGIRPPEGVDIFANPSDKPRVHMLRYFDKRDTVVPDYWRNVHGHLAGGLVVGGVDQMYQLINDFWDAAELAEKHGLAVLDEGLLSYVVAQNPERYSFSYGDYADILRNHDKIRGGEGHLLWQLDDAKKRDRPEHILALDAAVGDDQALAHKLNINRVDLTAVNAAIDTAVAQGWARVIETTDRLLGLVMIVKNEAHGIRETLASFKPFIDYWTILDTGSTDGTQDIIREALAGIPGVLHEESFVDFSTSRNRALDLHGEVTTFTIMPDSDDQLVCGDALRIMLDQKRAAGEDGFMLNLRRGELSYWLVLVLRSRARWRYTGSVHEVIASPPGSAPPRKIPATKLVQNRPAQSTEATTKRWNRDLALLQADLAKNPRDPRTLFYLAQTYECLGMRERALAAYDQRIEVGGWREEMFEAKFRRAKILHTLKYSWGGVQDAYLDAHRFDPKRAEPLFKIAEHWHSMDAHALTYLFASRAAALSRPETVLFVDEEIYAWKAADLVAISAYYLEDAGAKRVGAKAAEKVVRVRPGDERSRANWAFYAPSATEMFAGYRAQPIELTPEPPYVATNPSVFHDYVTGQWRCIVRTTNYRIVNGQYLTPDDNVIFTRNVMLELVGDHSNGWGLHTTKAVEMLDKTNIPRSSYPVHGFEDCRLFKDGATLFCTSTVCDFDLDRAAEGPREITLNEIDADYQIINATPLRGPWSHLAQKNWMPFADGAAIMYAAHPQNGRNATIFEITAERTVAPSDYPSETAFYGHGRLRGGSQVIPFGGNGGWLCLVHDVAWTSNARIYLHRFVAFDRDFKIVGMTDPFYFQKKGIEFCAGLAYDGKRLVASFGVDDCAAYFGIFDPAAVRARLRADFVI